ncbi:MAG: hypothetical protein ACRC4W_08160 [Treponemataceae bacterium]
MKNFILIQIVIILIILFPCCKSVQINPLKDDPLLSFPEFAGIEFAELVSKEDNAFILNDEGSFVVIQLSDFTKIAEFVLFVTAEEKKYKNWKTFEK